MKKSIFKRVWTGLGNRKLLNFVSDKAYLKIAYYTKNHIKLDLDNPKTYFEKLNWLKIHYRDDRYPRIVDKAEFKNYVIENLGAGGEKYLIKTIKVYDKVEDVNFDELPLSFAIKCTHDSHSVHIVKNKTKVNESEIKKDLKKHFKKNLYYYAREWPYKNIKPRIIVEELLNQDSKDEYLVDYKWFCFNGEPKVMYICCDAGKRPEIAFFDMEYNRLNMRDSDPQMKESPEKPHHFDEMMELSRKLSKGMPHVRVDFYIDSHDKLYIGEMTFFHSAGYSRFCPEDKEKMMGDYLDISNIK